jgi:ABC-2 type transport system permease protein
MNKTLLIFKREYLTRVKNKTFLLSTFLLPIVMILFFVGTAFFAATSKDKLKKIAVINDPGYFKANIKTDSTRLSFSFVTDTDSLNYKAKGFDAVLNLKSDSNTRSYVMHSQKQLGLETMSRIEDRLNSAFENYQLQQRGIQKTVLDSINAVSNDAFSVENRVIDEKGKSAAVNAAVSSGIGFASGILIYITMFVFGAMVMRGVMEEKTNRIAEVMVSSVKPFELMMGKILGIAAVGLTQFALWIILMMTLSSVAGAFLAPQMLDQANVAGAATAVQPNSGQITALLGASGKALSSVNWPLVIGCFAFYFLGGYLFYASLFAAIGSVINEDPQEAQSLMLPITMPIIFAFIILSSNINTPDSPVMIWSSMIPFTSPIVMMGRIPSGVPWYQLAISMGLLVGGFIFTTWLAGKIYRTGILMYGKKASWKEMMKWVFTKS